MKVVSHFHMRVDNVLSATVYFYMQTTEHKTHKLMFNNFTENSTVH